MWAVGTEATWGTRVQKRPPWCGAGSPEAQEGLLWAAHLRVQGWPQCPVRKCVVGGTCDYMHEDPLCKGQAPLCWPCRDDEVPGGQGSWGSLAGPQGSGKTLGVTPRSCPHLMPG